jgi:hypothetical protein
MASKPDELLPSAKDFMQKLALAEAEEASKQARKMAEEEAEKKALLDTFTKPSGVSDEEGIRRRSRSLSARSAMARARCRSAETAPHVLDYAVELLVDGRTLERPVNYALVRVAPPKGVEIDPTRRPFVIVDPRAGHGPGIGGLPLRDYANWLASRIPSLTSATNANRRSARSRLLGSSQGW